jgi:hypothetical protein
MAYAQFGYSYPSASQVCKSAINYNKINNFSTLSVNQKLPIESTKINRIDTKQKKIIE